MDLLWSEFFRVPTHQNVHRNSTFFLHGSCSSHSMPICRHTNMLHIGSSPRHWYLELLLSLKSCAGDSSWLKNRSYWMSCCCQAWHCCSWRTDVWIHLFSYSKFPDLISTACWYVHVGQEGDQSDFWGIYVSHCHNFHLLKPLQSSETPTTSKTKWTSPSSKLPIVLRILPTSEIKVLKLTMTLNLFLKISLSKAPQLMMNWMRSCLGLGCDWPPPHYHPQKKKSYLTNMVDLLLDWYTWMSSLNSFHCHFFLKL